MCYGCNVAKLFILSSIGDDNQEAIDSMRLRGSNDAGMGGFDIPDQLCGGAEMDSFGIGTK